MLPLTARIDSHFLGLPMLWRCLIIIAFLAVMAAIAWRKRMLTGSGTAAAAALGFIVFYIGGVSGISVFLFFFLTASISSRVTPVPVDVVRKGGRRDWMQVIANGVPAAAALVLYRFQGWDPIFLAAFTAALAEAEADTFASSFGLMSDKPPHSIMTGTIVPPGISGGVTLLGSMAGLAGAFLVALLGSSTFMLGFSGFAVAMISGFAGCIFDSVLGAVIQVQYRAPDGRLTEKSEIDGKKLERVRGIPFIDNDAVNLLSGLFSASLALLFMQIA